MARIERPEIEAGCRWLASVQEIRGLNGHDNRQERDYFARCGAEELLAIRDRMVPPADPDETPLLGRSARCGPGHQDYARIRITPGRAEGYLPGSSRPTFVWPLPASYLPPAHRRLLAEAIGAGDFAECWEAWQVIPAITTNRPCRRGESAAFLCLRCYPGQDIGYGPLLIGVDVADPPSRFSYWCGQCQRCGVIYWHRGPEQRGTVPHLPSDSPDIIAKVERRAEAIRRGYAEFLGNLDLGLADVARALDGTQPWSSEQTAEMIGPADPRDDTMPVDPPPRPDLSAPWTIVEGATPYDDWRRAYGPRAYGPRARPESP